MTTVDQRAPKRLGTHEPSPAERRAAIEAGLAELRKNPAWRQLCRQLTRRIPMERDR